MAAWLSSPYRAVGVYLGGANIGLCCQPNLTAAWVSRESAAGWHLIPTYVGLQAPSNSCGCQGIDRGRAAAQGSAAAGDAIAHAASVGLGAGNPIYTDMETTRAAPPTAARCSPTWPAGPRSCTRPAMSPACTATPTR